MSRILRGEDDRLVVVVGPCSIHDPGAALEYARRLAPLADELADDLRIVMRVYFEKPRTTVGWKGLDQRSAPRRQLRRQRGAAPRAAACCSIVVALGLPAGCEFLDPITPQFIADVVTWGAIGARTTESQVHRELASGLSMPVGFKNGTGGGVQIAIDAMHAAAYPAPVPRRHRAGRWPRSSSTRGNPDCHVILRGGRSGPNYDAASVRQTLAALQRRRAAAARDDRRQPRQQRQGLPPPARRGAARSPSRSRRAKPASSA